MAARAFWQGQIRLALVSIPVEIYAATKSGAKISFHQIHEPRGKRIQYEKVAPGVGPADDLAEEAYVVLREALRTEKKVALGQLSVRGREYLVSIKPCGKGLLLETLRYADEVRAGQSFFKSIGTEKPDKDMLELAAALIDKKTAPFDAGEFHDRYTDALQRIIDKKAKAKGKKVIEEAEEPAGRGSTVIDLMAALKTSVKEEKPAKKASSMPA